MSLSDAETMYNEALGIIGDYKIPEGDTTSKQAVICIRYYEDALYETLASHPWNEAKKRVILYENTDRPIFGYDRKYTEPTDCLRVLTVDTSIGSDVSKKQAGVPAWEVEDGKIFSDAGASPGSWSSGEDYYAGQFASSSSVTYEVLVSHTSDATGANEAAQVAVDVAAGNIISRGGDYDIVFVEYIYKLITLSKWKPKLKQAIAINLASKIVIDLYAGSEKRRESLINELNGLVMPQARSVDAAVGKPRPIFQSEWLRSRQGYGSGDYYVT